MNNDLISREALKEALAKEIKTNDMGLWLKILLVIDNAPTVEPERTQDKWEEFARWVAKEVLDNYFEESSGAFAEIACRKLVKLGLVEVKDNVYKMKGGAK